MLEDANSNAYYCFVKNVFSSPNSESCTKPLLLKIRPASGQSEQHQSCTDNHKDAPSLKALRDQVQPTFRPCSALGNTSRTGLDPQCSPVIRNCLRMQWLLDCNQSPSHAIYNCGLGQHCPNSTELRPLYSIRSNSTTRTPGPRPRQCMQQSIMQLSAHLLLSPLLLGVNYWCP